MIKTMIEKRRKRKRLEKMREDAFEIRTQTEEFYKNTIAEFSVDDEYGLSEIAKAFYDLEMKNCNEVISDIEKKIAAL